MNAVSQALVFGALGAVLAVDRIVFLQTMASRPLVACALAGSLLGESALGLHCGLILELLWMMELPVGASVPPDDTLAALLAVAFSAAAPGGWSEQARAAFGVLAAVPLGAAGRHLDLAVRRWNGGLLAEARRLQPGGSSLGRLHYVGALRFAGAGALAAALGALGGVTAIRWIGPALPATVGVGLELVGGLLPLVGLASVLAALPGRRYLLLVGCGAVAGLGWNGLAGPAGGKGAPWAR